MIELRLPVHGTLRWVKAHFFQHAGRQGWQPLSAVEGLEGSSALITWGTDGSVEILERKIDTETPRVSLAPLNLKIGERFLLKGSAPLYDMSFDMSEENARAGFRFECGWPIWWSRWGRIFRYAGQHSDLKVEIIHGDARFELEGLGVMEHVCGISLPFRFTRYTPFHYHWDVLRFDEPGSPYDSAAGLSIGMGGDTVIRLRAAAKLPGREPEALSGLTVSYVEVYRGRDVFGNDTLSPVRWKGVLRGGDWVMEYEASATTPVAGVIPSGGMLGFEFESECRFTDGRIMDYSGTGFTEYGDFSGKLVDLAEREAVGSRT